MRFDDRIDRLDDRVRDRERRVERPNPALEKASERLLALVAAADPDVREMFEDWGRERTPDEIRANLDRIDADERASAIILRVVDGMVDE